jgi:OOP family OmpA-OmpF porin
MSLRKALLAATMLALPVAAQAQPITGLYVGAGAGVNWLMETDLTPSGALRSVVGTGNADFEYGFVGVVSVGYGFGNGVRAEIEGSYRQNEISGVTGFGNSIPAPRTQSGDVQSYGVMVNALYDFNLGPASFFHPYVGLGIGYIVQNWDNVGVRGPGGNSVILDGDNGNFAGQVIVGAAFPIASVPGLAITAEYRFMGALSDDVDARVRTASGTTVAQRSGAMEVDNWNQSLLLGIRYAFNAAPPPPPPVVAAAPAPARTYLVFFDWDRYTLTDRARQIIAEAATNAQRTSTTRIEVAGHADRSGTPQYNQRLSQRRADAVAAELERRGIPRTAMTIQAFGETRPLVPTADGVREPQNRRVEIVLR